MLVSEKSPADLASEVARLKQRIAELEDARGERMPSTMDTALKTDENECSRRRDEERFRDFAESSADWFWESDARHRFTYLSPNVERLIGVPAEWHYGKSRVDFVARTADTDALDQYLAALDAHEPFREFVYYRVGDGSGIKPKWLSVSGKPFFDDAGKFLGYRGSGRDISHEHEMRAQMARTDRLLRDALDSMGDALFVFDADDRLVVCNNRYRRLFGDLADRVVPGAKFEDLIRVLVTSGSVAAAQGRVEAYLRDRMGRHREPKEAFELTLASGGWVRITEQRTSDGGWIGIISDITEYKNALETAEQANSVKTKFLAAASHDLRQPLQALTLMLRLLSSRVEGTKTRELVQDAEGALEVMSRLLNALLDISKLDAGLVVPETEPCHVDDLLTRLARQFGPRARELGLDLRVVMPDAWVMTDVGLLERIIENLLANALRYTKKGGVLIGCRRRGENLRIEVWDTGIGIADDQIEEVFSEFHQIGNAERDRTRGLGLGLAIVDRLASLLGHAVDVRSLPGRGSMFAVQVPLAEAPVVETPSGKTRDRDLSVLEGLTVLVIEDDDNVRHAIGMALEELKISVLAAANGPEALDLVGHAPRPPNVIFADYRLPGDARGHQVVARIRDQCGIDIPATIITADTAPSELREVELSGCRLLYKPVEMDVLIDVLLAACDAPRT